jgi:hypothetical protein
MAGLTVISGKTPEFTNQVEDWLQWDINKI